MDGSETVTGWKRRSREGGLEDVGGVHAALGVARADDVVHLVDHEDHVSGLADIVDQALHAALKLAAELRPRHERREIEQIHALIAQLVRHVAGRDALRQTLGDGCLADAGLADEAGVVLLPAVEDLQHALELLRAADHAVELAGFRPRGEVDAVIVEKFALFRRGAAAVAGLLFALRRLALHGLHRVRIRAEEPVEEGEGCGLAVVVFALLVSGEVGEVLRRLQQLLHIAGDAVEILVREAHALHHLVHGLDVQRAGALEAEALIVGFAVFNAGERYKRVRS